MQGLLAYLVLHFSLTEASISRFLPSTTDRRFDDRGVRTTAYRPVLTCLDSSTQPSQHDLGDIAYSEPLPWNRRDTPILGSAHFLRGLDEVFRDVAQSATTNRRASAQGGPGAHGANVDEHEPVRRRPSPSGPKLAHAVGLKEFMHRTRVLGLYRGILKVTYQCFCSAGQG